MSGVDLSRLAFHRPDLLWLLAGAALVFLVRARAAAGTAGGERVRSFLAMWGRVAAYSAVVLAAAGPYTTEDRPDLAVAVVVDGSASSAGDRLAGYLERARQLADAWPDGPDEARPVVVSLGATPGGDGTARVRVHRDAASLEGEVEAASAGSGTDLAPAVEEALAHLPRAKSRSILLLTDGAETRGDLHAVAALAAARDVKIHPFPPDAGRVSVSARGLALTQGVRIGDPASAEVEIVANAEADARVVLTGPARAELARTGAVRLAPGTNRVPLLFKAPEAAGLHAVRARVEAAGDHFRGDDEVPGLIHVLPSARALLVGESEASEPLRDALAAATPPLVVDVASPARVPDLTSYDLVALLDPDLPSRAADAGRLRDWVRRGGRLLVTGGEHGLVVDRPGLEPVEELLPLRFPKTEKEEPAPLAVVYCVDRSDSMARYAKFETALTAVAASVDLLQPEAEVGVLTFSDFPHWAVPLTPASKKPEILDRLAALQIHGGTSIFPALDAAYAGLRESRALVRHVVLLTDGRSTTVYERHGAVVDTIRNAGITLSTVALSREADQEQLQKIAEVGGGRFYYTEDVRSVPRIVMDETMKVTKTNKVDETFSVHAVPGSRFLRGVDPKGIPSLGGYVRAKQKAGSELALATDRGEPVLVGWRFGRGAVTVFTSDVGGAWSTRWRRWGGRAALLRQVVKETLTPPPPPNLALTAEVHGDEARVVYSALDSLGAPMDELVIEGEAVGEEGRAEPLVFFPVGPGRYGASLTVRRDRAVLVRAVAAPGPGAPAGSDLVVSVSADPAEETLAGTVNLPSLVEVARVTGGKVSPPIPALLTEGVETREVEVERWRPLVWLGLVLLLADLALRRVRLPSRAGPQSSGPAGPDD